MKKTKIKDIFIINNFFSSSEIELLNKYLNAVNWKADGNSINQYADTNGDAPECVGISSLLEQKNSFLKENIEKDFNCSLGEEAPGTIVRYAKGWSLPHHADCWSNLPTHGGHPSRDISSVIYLTGDFEGGSLLFPDLDIEIQPMGGSAIYFPSDENHMHTVTEVISGNRSTCTGFWHILDRSP